MRLELLAYQVTQTFSTRVVCGEGSVCLLFRILLLSISVILFLAYSRICGDRILLFVDFCLEVSLYSSFHLSFRVL